MASRESFATVNPCDLPAPPQAAIAIMRACSREDVSNAELSELAASDPVLTAELLRVVNSAYFGFAKEVQTIPHAVMVLGQRALRNMALCIGVRDALGSSEIEGFSAQEFWEDATRRAVSARLLGERLSFDKDQCFTAGLLQDFGLLVLVHLQPEKGRLWSTLRAQDPELRHRTEQESFGITHDEVVEMLGRQWDLPGELTDALGKHHEFGAEPEAGEANGLAQILWGADQMATVYTAADKSAALECCKQLLREHLRLDAKQTEQLLGEVPGGVEQAAMALGFGISDQPDFEQVLRDTNVLLAEENRSYQELTWQLERTIDERDRLAEELARELQVAREIQQSLLPSLMGPDFPVSGVNLPARALSGDFYDYFVRSDGRIYFNLGDVSGKGTTAALLMAKASSLFRCLGKRVSDPCDLIGQINNELCETSTRGMFVTMVAGLYEPQAGSLRVVNAGHMPALLWNRNNRVVSVPAASPPLGIAPETEFTETQLSLDGGSFYVFSDGVTEGHVEEGQELGLKGLLSLIAKARNEPAGERLEAILAPFKKSAIPLRDDITLLLVEQAEV